MTGFDDTRFDDVVGGMVSAGDPVRIRTGTVIGFVGSQVRVRLANTTVTSAFYLTSVGALSNGDPVVMLVDGRRLLVIGRPFGPGPTVIPNAEFDLVGASGVPQFWQTYHASTAANVSVQTPGGTQRTLRVLSQSSGAAPGIDTYVYSAAIDVTLGSRWALSASTRGQYPAAQLLDATLGALWFANSDELLPNTSAANTAAQTITSIPTSNTPLGGTVTVPANANFMRVYCETVSGVGEAGALHWWGFDAQLVA